LNFVAANDYLDAANKYITNYKETRNVISIDAKTGKTINTGKKQEVTVTGVVTWTPGDVNVAEQKGGLVSIISTAEYKSQMPATIIGIGKYFQDNRKQTEAFLKSIFEGGDQVKTFDAALVKAGEISAKVYNDKDGNYWYKFYKGLQQSDKTGTLVSLGGSRSFNLADNLAMYGLDENKTNVYASVYKVFGDIVVKLYPEVVPNYPSIEEVLDLTYISNVKNGSGTSATTADKVTFKNTGEIKDAVSKRAWKIEFQSGSASFTPEALATLNDLYNQLIVANGLSIEVIGHTDNTGTPSGNDALSMSRAAAVKQWLQSKSSGSFPESRFAAVLGKGQNQPIADNSTPVGKAKNRRVEIILGK
jgi:outer membrane protein OmpA-like peptidoglycan-associated protein